MASVRLNFTKRSLLALDTPPKGKRAYYRDTVVKGLILDVRSSGSKSFYLYKFLNGKPERIFLGIFPDLTVENARDAATIHRSSIAQGKNPQDEKRKIRNEMTFEELFHEYMERYSKIHKKSWQYDEREVRKFLSHWFSRKLSDITKSEIRLLHEKIYNENGLYQANRILERIRAMYNKAIEWEWDGVNPAVGIKKYKEKSRDRFIQPNELPLLFNALEEDENEVAKDYFLMSLMTGARKSNVLAMRWEQVNWHQKQWRIPDTKNGESVIVPLIDQAMDILERRKNKAKNDFVFEGEGAKGYLADPKHAWERIRQKATLELWKLNKDYDALIQLVEDRLRVQDNYGYTIVKLIKEVQKEAQYKNINLPTGLLDLRIHDIRRTLGSYQAITGASLPIIGKTLGHKNSQSTAIYARLNLDPVRDSMSKAVGAMLESK
jgi:integrase